MSEKVKHWIHGLVGGVIGGAATAGSSWLAMAGAQAAGIDVPLLNWKALGVILVVGAVSNTLAYLKQSPLPPEDDAVAEIKKFGAGPTPPAVPMILMIGLMAVALSGCASLYTNIVTMKKVGDSISVEYAQLYKDGLISPAQDVKAEAAHAEYREAMGVLATALEAAQLSGDASDVPGKLRAAKQAIAPMLNLISPLLSNRKANTLQKQLTTASAQ